MKNFYMKYKNPIGIVMDIILIVLGIYSRNLIFAILGVILLFLTLYVSKLEKQSENEKARMAAEKQAFKAEQKRINKGKKKKKSKKRK